MRVAIKFKDICGDERMLSKIRSPIQEVTCFVFHFYISLNRGRMRAKLLVAGICMTMSEISKMRNAKILRNESVDFRCATSRIIWGQK